MYVSVFLFLFLFLFRLLSIDAHLRLLLPCPLYTYLMIMCLTCDLISIIRWKPIFNIYSLLFVLGVDALDVPEQIHISFGDRPDIMVAMWSCKSHITCHVVYGTSGENMTNHSTSHTSTLNLDSWNALKIIYRAELKVLHVDISFNDDW